MTRWVGIVTVLLAIAVSAAVIIEGNRRMMEDNRDIARCLVEQLAEHRLDNRGSHETLSEQHNDVATDRIETDLPDPPITLPAPNPEIQQELLEACEPYLHRSRVQR